MILGLTDSYEIICVETGFCVYYFPSPCQFILNLYTAGPTPMDVSVTAQEISSTDVTVLEGHSSEVFACAWSPTGSLLASGCVLIICYIA
jgi:WD40 repeat protein